jgi:maltose alpha-D-glucosyltransferase/alpha-amylase
MAFHFPVMPRLFMAIRMEDRFPIVDILKQTPTIPDICQWAIFLRNHDELTLEMVTDEERDYMYRSYASDLRARINLGIRRRLAPLLGNDRRTIELMNSLLFSLPGTPVLYYGDEIGMGDNIYLGDRNGVRTPMQWSGDRNAGFSDANPQRLYLPAIIDPEYHFGTVNVEAQQANPNSLLWWMKRMIALRKRYKAFGRGTIEFLYPDNRKVLVFLRQYEDEKILVVVNLSRLVQYVDLDLTRFGGLVPVELFGRTEFPPVTDRPFFMTLSPHSFYWFELTPTRRPSITIQQDKQVPLVRAASLHDLLDSAASRQLEQLLRDYVVRQRWYRSKSRVIRELSIFDAIPIDVPGADSMIAVIEIDYPEGEAENYVLPLIRVSKERADQLGAIAICELRHADDNRFVIDASHAPEFAAELLDLVLSRRRFATAHGTVVATALPALREIVAQTPPAPRLLRVEQTNTSIAFDGKLIMKLYRRIEEGRGLDLEVGRFLTKHGFPHAPRVVGAIEYEVEKQVSTLAVLHSFTANEGDAWQFTIDTLGTFYERAAARGGRPAVEPVSTATLLQNAAQEPPQIARELVGSYLEDARLLGLRTAELHNVLSSDPDDPDFALEPFTIFYQRSLYQSMRNLTGRVFQSLAARLHTLPEGLRTDAQQVLELQPDVLARFRRLIEMKIHGVRIRCHGDYHLGQVLFTGKDFVITDFEGEPLHPLSERRLKRSPLRDVAGMLRSFDYAAYTPLVRGQAGIVFRTEDRAALEQWARAWDTWVAASFLGGYFGAAAAVLVPPTMAELETLLDAYLLEKAVYELGYEMNNRPDWLPIPIRGMLELLGKRFT